MKTENILNFWLYFGVIKMVKWYVKERRGEQFWKELSLLNSILFPLKAHAYQFTSKSTIRKISSHPVAAAVDRVC